MTQAAIKAALEQENKDGTVQAELAKMNLSPPPIIDNDKSKLVKPEGTEGGDEFKDDQSKTVVVKQGFLQRCRAKCCKKDPHVKPVGLESNPNLRIKNTIKRIVNGRFVLTLMTFVTLFALIGVSMIAPPWHINLM